MIRRPWWISLIVLMMPLALAAQVPGLTTPEASLEASVSQKIGLTEMGVSYHRPAVNKRQIWGALVPYGHVWRAGANENTTVSFSTDVMVNGQKLPAGTYGLHMIPAEGEWTVIFSREAGAWGSDSYDQAEDALRVKVTPEAAPFQERLSFGFEDPTQSSAVLAMRWEKLRVPVTITIDLPRTVLESYKKQLRGLPRFGWQGWNQAASWAAQHDIELQEAMGWVERSISLNRNFSNLQTKARLLRKQGEAAAADALTKEALAVATENEMNNYGYQLLGEKKVDEAIAIFERNIKQHPDSWNTYDSLAEALAVKGDRRKALQYYKKAYDMTEAADQKQRIAALMEGLRN